MDKTAIKSAMNLWRLGITPMPPEYITIHREAAEKSLPKMAAMHGLRVLHTEMVSDGWYDGMRVLRAVCEDQTGKFHDMRWSDSNGGSWFEKFQSGGQALVEFTPDDRPGHL